jgi:alpha-1,2-mannosyltransferase
MTIPAGKTANPADDLYFKLTVAALVFFVVLEAAYFVLSGVPSFFDPSLDFTGNAIGRDFITTWMSGRSMLGFGPASLFDHVVFNNALRVMLGPNFPEHFWSYPPHIILFTWPFGLLPYLPAYVLWCVLGVAFYLLACMATLRREYLLFLAAAPGIAICVFFGQNGFYTAALLIGGLALLERRPLLAGVLFGILTVKPQLGILLPVVLLLNRRWWTILSATVTAGALMAAAGYVFGPEVWTDFIDKVMPQQVWLLHHGGGLLYLMVSSVFFGARLVGLPFDLAWNLQALVSTVALAAVIWTYWQKRDPVLSMALFVTATFLASPYVLNYDMVVFGFVVAALHQRGGNMAFDHALALLVWTLPVSMMLFGAVDVPFAPLVLMAFAGRLLWRLVHETSGQRDAVSEDAVVAAAPAPPPAAEQEPPEAPALEPTPA